MNAANLSAVYAGRADAARNHIGKKSFILPRAYSAPVERIAFESTVAHVEGYEQLAGMFSHIAKGRMTLDECVADANKMLVIGDASEIETARVVLYGLEKHAVKHS